MTDSTGTSKKTRVVTGVLAVLILIPSLWGFGTKFIEFVALFRGDVDGAFAISPICNYLFASLGFFCLLCWAMMNGMFSDIEKPKVDMLETERLLDEQELNGNA